ncbi:MAG: hypothetical protein K2M31_03230 [Muribaculaceae bacterium]|nr:hypothetical protein [Muribaculaceae bacterium]
MKFCQILLLIGIPLLLWSFSPASLPADLDRDKAEKFMTEIPLRGPEGLWEFEPDEVTLMILSDENLPGVFNIYVVDAVDCRLAPGMMIGCLESTVDKKSYRISLSTRWKNNEIYDECLPLEGTVRLDSKSETLLIEGKSGKISISPSIALPNLLSLLRVRVRINVNDPTSRLPSGLRRLYPASNDLPDSPRYL